MIRTNGWVFFLFLASLMAMVGDATAGSLETGMTEYKAENYEEAVESLEKARKEDPESTLAAFFLGMAYKKTMDYAAGAKHLEDAVTGKPPIEEALVELVDALLVLGKPEDLYQAWFWINTAENKDILSGQTAFLKGRLLKKEGKFEKAIAAFEVSKEKSPELSQSCDLQTALCRVRLNQLKSAKEMLEKVIRQDPTSDLSAFARNYMEMVESRIYTHRPFRFTFTALGRYDTNMILKPTDDAAAEGVTDEKGFVNTDTLRLEFVPDMKGLLNFYAQYSGVLNFHQHNGRTHDLIGNSLLVQPGYTFSDGLSLHFKTEYTHFLRRNPDYEGYLGQFTAGPVLKVFPAKRHFLEASAFYLQKDYFDTASSPDECRDANTGELSAAWIWLFRDKWLFHLKYTFSHEDADGRNWENTGNRFTADTIYPILDNLRLQAGLDIFLQNYDNTHSVFGKTREDHTNTGSIGITWDIYRYLSLITQYTRTRCNSNIGIYDYTRNQISGGLEIRF